MDTKSTYIWYHHKLTNFMHDSNHNDYSVHDDWCSYFNDAHLHSLDTKGNIHLSLVPGVLKLSSKNFKTISSFSTSTSTLISNKNKNKNKSNGYGSNYIMKEFEPIFNILPSFMVKTDKIKDYTDKYVIVKVTQVVDSITSKRSLIGTIDRYIGDVGDMNVEKNLCQIMSTCHWNRKIDRLMKRTTVTTSTTSITPITSTTSTISNQSFISNTSTKCIDPLWIEFGISDHDITPNRIDLLSTARNNIYTISIDPEGSKDIDDAISIEIPPQWNSSNNECIVIGIHIADPSSYLIEGSDLDKEVANRVESVYLKDSTYHMFPEELSTNLFSLKQNTLNRAFSVIFNVKMIDGVWIDVSYQITKTLINIDNNMTYDDFQSIINGNSKSDNVEYMKILYWIGRDMYMHYLDSNMTTIYSAKKMIEVFMVLANCRVAENMVKLGLTSKIFTPVIIRSQQTSTYNNLLNINNNLSTTNSIHNESLLTEHIKLHTSSAELRYYNSMSPQFNKHSSLNLDLYTHFTSPIRRYSDILVHRIIYNLLTDSRVFTLTCMYDGLSKGLSDDNILESFEKIGIHEMFQMNHYKKFYKSISRYEKDLYIANYVTDILKYCPEDRIIQLHGVILDIIIESIPNTTSITSIEQTSPQTITQSTQLTQPTQSTQSHIQTKFKSKIALSDKIITLRIKCLFVGDNIDNGINSNCMLAEYLIGCIHTIKITHDMSYVNSDKIKLFEEIDYKMCILTRDARKIRTYL